MSERVWNVEEEKRRESTEWLELAMEPLEDTDVTPATRLLWLALQEADSRLSRRDMRRATGMAQGTVHNNVERLQEAGLLEITNTTGQHGETLFRPAVAVEEVSADSPKGTQLTRGGR